MDTGIISVLAISFYIIFTATPFLYWCFSGMQRILDHYSLHNVTLQNLQVDIVLTKLIINWAIDCSGLLLWGLFVDFTHVFLNQHIWEAMHTNRHLYTCVSFLNWCFLLLSSQVYPMYSLFYYFCTDRLEQCFLFGHIYFSTYGCCWYSRQGLKSQDIAQISKALCSRPPTRELQYVPLLDYDGWHIMAEPCTLLCTIVHLHRDQYWHMEYGKLVDNSSCYISQCALGNGYSALGVGYSCCSMGLNCCNLWLHGGAWFNTCFPKLWVSYLSFRMFLFIY